MYKMYYIYKDGDKLIGSSSSIDFVIEFTKLIVDAVIGSTEKGSKLKQLYEDKVVVNSPKVGLNQLQPILERLGYKLEVDIK